MFFARVWSSERKSTEKKEKPRRLTVVSADYLIIWRGKRTKTSPGQLQLSPSRLGFKDPLNVLACACLSLSHEEVEGATYGMHELKAVYEHLALPSVCLVTAVLSSEFWQTTSTFQYKSFASESIAFHRWPTTIHSKNVNNLYVRQVFNFTPDFVVKTNL